MPTGCSSDAGVSGDGTRGRRRAGRQPARRRLRAGQAAGSPDRIRTRAAGPRRPRRCTPPRGWLGGSSLQRAVEGTRLDGFALPACEGRDGRECAPVAVISTLSAASTVPANVSTEFARYRVECIVIGVAGYLRCAICNLEHCRAGSRPHTSTQNTQKKEKTNAEVCKPCASICAKNTKTRCGLLCRLGLPKARAAPRHLRLRVQRPLLVPQATREAQMPRARRNQSSRAC